MSAPERAKIVWKAESTHPDQVESLKTALREVVDPELGLNVIELGLIRDVMIEEKKAQVTMILTTPFCPYGPAMLEMTRDKAEKSLKRSTTITLGREVWDFSMMEEGAAPEWGMY